MLSAEVEMLKCDSARCAQVKQNTEMESHEEKLHKMIIQSKINDTKVRTSR